MAPFLNARPHSALKILKNVAFWSKFAFNAFLYNVFGLVTMKKHTPALYQSLKNTQSLIFPIIPVLSL